MSSAEKDALKRDKITLEKQELEEKLLKSEMTEKEHHLAKVSEQIQDEATMQETLSRQNQILQVNISKTENFLILMDNFNSKL